MTRSLLCALACALLAACSGQTQSDADKTVDAGKTQVQNALASAGISNATVKDQLLRSAIKARLTADDPDSTISMGVSVKDLHVTLTGTVRTDAERTSAAATAKSMHDVASVDNELRVDPKQASPQTQLGDLALAARVQTAIVDQIGLTDARVSVKNGTATITGTVNADQHRTAIATAHNTKGIHTVVDQMRVDQK